MIPAASLAAYDAARHRAASIDRSDRGRIVVSGADRASYLQGLLTNDVVALKSGQGCYTAYLTAQGRMISDLHVYELGDVMLLTMAGDVKDTVLAKLDQFIFSEDVQLGDVTGTFAQIAVVGPEAAQAVARVLGGVSADALARAGRSTGTCAREWAGGAGDRHARRPTPANRATTCSSIARRRTRSTPRSAAAGVVEAGRGDGRGDSDRGGRSAVSPRHGRGDDSARGGHRVARDQLHARAATSGRKS